jgi:hypothetical protein
MALLDTIKLAEFSVQEQACHAKRLVLHCLWKKAMGRNDDVYVTPLLEVVDLSKEGTILTVTKDSSGVKELEMVSKSMKVPCICLPIKSVQLHRFKALKKKREYNQALKGAMVIYDSEQQMPDGMSTQTVVDLIKNELGVQL